MFTDKDYDFQQVDGDMDMFPMLEELDAKDPLAQQIVASARANRKRKRSRDEEEEEMSDDEKAVKRFLKDLDSEDSKGKKKKEKKDKREKKKENNKDKKTADQKSAASNDKASKEVAKSGKTQKEAKIATSEKQESQKSKKQGKNEAENKGENTSKKDTKQQKQQKATEEKKSCDTKQWEDMGVCEEICKALSDKGFSTPTPVQAASLPEAIQNMRDLVAAADTGSGKTLAFGIPIVQRLVQQAKQRKNEENDNSEDTTNGKDTEESEKFMKALILAPTRELAIQVTHHIIAITKYTDIKVVTIVGGMSAEKQIRLLSKRPEIVVATPGRYWELVSDQAVHVSDMRGVEFLVLDEADRMVQDGHFPELSSILSLLYSQQETDPEKHVKRRQTFLFSATISLATKYRKKFGAKIKNQSGDDTIVEKLMDLIKFNSDEPDKKKNRKNKKKKKQENALKPHFIDLTSPNKLVSTLSEYRISCVIEEKDLYVYYCTQTPRLRSLRTLVFVNSITCVKRLVSILTLLGIVVYPLHSKMQQRQRLKNLDRFTEATTPILMVATDVASRGLDIPQVDLVIHYQMPRTREIYIHRCGRTARAQASGTSIALMAPEDYGTYTAVRPKDGSITSYPIEQNLVDGLKPRIALAKKIDQKVHAYNKQYADEAWLKKVGISAEVMDRDDDDSDSDDEKPKKKKRKTSQDNVIMTDPDMDHEEISERQFLQKRYRLEVEGLKKELKRIITSTVAPQGRGISHKFITYNPNIMTSAVTTASTCPYLATSATAAPVVTTLIDRKKLKGVKREKRAKR